MEERLILEYFNKIEEKIKTEKILRRELEVKPIKNKVISIIGPRRAGKTYFLFSIFKENIENSIYLDFENIAIKKVSSEDVFKVFSLFENYFKRKIKNVFLDEIQTMQDWQTLVRSLLDFGYNVFITGSSSKLLSKEIATQLRGRGISYYLLPFSFREYLIINKIEIKEHFSISEEIRIKKLLEDYLEWGGYPEVVLFPNNRELLLKEYYDLIFYRDFVERFEAKSLNVASLIFEFMLQNLSKEISVNKIANYVNSRLRINTKTTIYDYVDKISDIYFVFFVERFRKSVYERKSWPKKIYICDVGLANLVKFNKDIGKRMENVVFLELMRKVNKNPLFKTFYLNGNFGEIDFVIKEGLKIKQFLQVTYASAKDEVENREIKSLLKASKELRCKNLVIITWDYEDEIEIKNRKILFKPLWKWLLEKS